MRQKAPLAAATVFHLPKLGSGSEAAGFDLGSPVKNRAKAQMQYNS